jgi:hypothetical protein
VNLLRQNISQSYIFSTKGMCTDFILLPSHLPGVKTSRYKVELLWNFVFDFYTWHSVTQLLGR